MKWLSLPLVSALLLLSFDALAAIQRVEVLEDATMQLTFEQVEVSPDFRDGRRAGENFGVSKSAHWMRVTIGPGGANRLLEVGYPILDRVDFYLPGGRTVLTGDTVPFSQRDVRDRSFVCRLPANEQPMVVYLRVHSDGVVSVPITVHDADVFSQRRHDEHFLFGAYFAFLLALAGYHFFVVAINRTRDRAFSFYVSYLVTQALFQASASGYAFMHLWPSSPAWGNAATFTFLGLTLGSGTLLAREVSNSSVIAPRLHRVLTVAAYVAFACSLLVHVNYRAGGIAIVLVSMVSAPIVIPTVLITSVRAGYRPARYALLGYACIIPGAIMAGLHYAGVIPSGFLADNGLRLGTAFEALLDSFAVAYRIRLIVEAKDDAERLVLEARRKFSDELLRAQDVERKRIAAELHDGVGQSLMVIANGLDRLDAEDPQRKSALQAAADTTVDELRRVAHALYPHKLERLGLAAALREVVEKTAQAARLECAHDIDDVDDLLPPGADIQIYRIVQEALKNVVNHAHAEHVQVALRWDGQQVELTVEDDGGGMSGDGTPSMAGFGLRSMEERALLLGGSFSAVSNEPHGVALCIKIPAAAERRSAAAPAVR